MFTVKHITLSGTETIHGAEKVTFHPAPRDCAFEKPSLAELVDFIDLGGDRYLRCGTVFVMNATGKTVSRYDLGASDVPLSGTPPLGGYARAS